MHINTQNIDIKPQLFLIALIQAILLLLLLKSFALWAIFIALISGIFFLYIFPELGFAFALTNNILLYIFFDYVRVNITAPVVIVYALILITSTSFFLIKKDFTIDFIKDKILIISMLIGLIMIFGYFYSSNKTFGLYKTAFYFINNLPLLLVGILLKEDKMSIVKLLIFAYAIGLLVSIISILISLDDLYFDFMRFRPSENVSPITLSRTLGTAALFSLFLFAKANNKIIKLIIIFSMPLLLAPMIWSGTRAPLIGLLGAALVYYLAQPKQSLYKKFFVSIIGLSSALFLLFRSSSQIATRMTTPITQEASAAFRILAWFKGIQDFLKSPFLGTGTGSFKLETNWIELKWAHNLIIEMAGENGIAGLFLILFFLYLTTVYGIKTITYFNKTGEFLKLQLSICMLALFVFTLWNSMFSGAIFSNALVWFSAGLIIALKPKN